ncbi:MAG: hypothetical protein EOP06_02790 [Proteobacteria bacterium]|nr:MAG: hypothetical protein EOP06_02790 [Pseudomonadota bacterium]
MKTRMQTERELLDLVHEHGYTSEIYNQMYEYIRYNDGLLPENLIRLENLSSDMLGEIIRHEYDCFSSENRDALFENFQNHGYIRDYIRRGNLTVPEMARIFKKLPVDHLLVAVQDNDKIDTASLEIYLKRALKHVQKNPQSGYILKYIAQHPSITKDMFKELMNDEDGIEGLILSHLATKKWLMAVCDHPNYHVAYKLLKKNNLDQEVFDKLAANPHPTKIYELILHPMCQPRHIEDFWKGYLDGNIATHQIYFIAFHKKAPSEVLIQMIARNEERHAAYVAANVELDRADVLNALTECGDHRAYVNICRRAPETLQYAERILKMPMDEALREELVKTLESKAPASPKKTKAKLKLA